jgi:Dullard-like phosphatase family protein
MLEEAYPGPCDEDGTNSEPAKPGNKPILVVDLDETIVYATPLKISQNSFPIRVGRYRMYVQVRPFVKEFFAALADYYDIVVFTAGNKEYTDQIIDKAFSFILRENRFYSDSCPCVSGYRVKDLSILRGPLHQIVLIDDMFGSALLQPHNVFVVPAWMGEASDGVFRSILPLLRDASSATNVIDELKKAIIAKKCNCIKFEEIRDQDEEDVKC